MHMRHLRSDILIDEFRGVASEPLLKVHFTLFTQQFRIQMQCVQYATYNSLGGCSKARSALTTALCKEKEKKLVGIKNTVNNNLITTMSAF